MTLSHFELLVSRGDETRGLNYETGERRRQNGLCLPLTYRTHSNTSVILQLYLISSKDIQAIPTNYQYAEIHIYQYKLRRSCAEWLSSQAGQRGDYEE